MRFVLSLLLALTAASAAWADAASSAAALDAQKRGDLQEAIRLYGQAIAAGGLPADEVAAAHFNRAAAYRKLGRLAGALADYDEAIRLKPDFAAAYDSRGNVHRERGELDKAILDYNMALKIKPDFANALDNRGNAYRDRGEPERAIIDYDAALKLRPDDIVAQYNRAHAEAELGRYDVAADDYRRVIALAPSNIYPVLLLHLALLRAGKEDSAEIRADAKRLDRTLWPAPVLALYLGETSPEDVVAVATLGTDDKAARQRACEINYYVGMYHLLHKTRAKAEQLFREAARQCPAGFYERSAALAELKRLGL
jgi:tetratricopeptide (TPR) repeat protein